MALIMPNSVFMRIMKTGSQFSWDALDNAGLIVGQTGSNHCGLETVRRDPRCKGKALLCAVRNPVSWYVSRWCAPPHRNRIEQGLPRQSDAHGREITNFNLWVNRTIDENPEGHLRHYYSKYLGPNYDQAHHVLRQESLTEDLVHALRKAGEKFSPAAIRNTQSINKSIDRWRKLAVYQPATLKRLLANERETMRMLDYPPEFAQYKKYIG